jgi:hypothetical protein
MSMQALRFPLAVIMARTPLASRWISERWEPVGVEFEAAPSPSAATMISDDAQGTRWRFGGMIVELHASEAEGCYLNITSAEPKLFVMWRTADAGVEPAAYPVIVTVSYNQAARMLDGGEQVDAIALPAGLRAWIEPFVAEHYRPEPRRKVRRNDPFRNDDKGGDRESRR